MTTILLQTLALHYSYTYCKFTLPAAVCALLLKVIEGVVRAGFGRDIWRGAVAGAVAGAVGVGGICGKEKAIVFCHFGKAPQEKFDHVTHSDVWIKLCDVVWG